jgi:plasmid stabilization system protein ParE
MEVHFKPETESGLNELASQSGRPTHELVEDAMAAYSGEVSQVRGMLDSRYDDLKSARVKSIDSEEAFGRLRRKNKSPRALMKGFVLHPDAYKELEEIWEYIYADNPEAADCIGEESRQTIHRLVQFPRQGHIRSDLTSRLLNLQPVREFLVVYAPEEAPLAVIAVLRGGVALA